MIRQKTQQKSPVADDEHIRRQFRSLSKVLSAHNETGPPSPPQPPFSTLQHRALACKSNRYAVSESKAALEADTSGAGTDGRRSAADARSSLSAVRCNWRVRGKVRGGAYCSEGSEVTGQVRHGINLERFQIALLKCRVRQTQKRGQHENG